MTAGRLHPSTQRCVAAGLWPTDENKKTQYKLACSVGEFQLSAVLWPGAADKDAGQKIDSHHTSDVLSEHITVTQTSGSLLASTQTL